MSSAKRQIFVIARVFDIMQFDNILQKCFNCSYRSSTSLPTRIMEPSTHWAFTCLTSAIETQEQDGKSVQSYYKRQEKKNVKWRCFHLFIVNFVNCTCYFYWIWTGKCWPRRTSQKRCFLKFLFCKIAKF